MATVGIEGLITYNNCIHQRQIIPANERSLNK